MYKYLIIEDEPLARKVIEKHMTQFPQFESAGISENVFTAFELISRMKIDVLFLDINLPGVNGIDFIKSLKNPPAVVFTTAYSEFAATSYELDAVDYLLKPITFERFAQAMNKILKQTQNKTKNSAPDFVFIKQKRKLIKVFFSEILYIEARKDYLMVNLARRSIITHMTMKSMEELLPSSDFIRVHRSYFVSKKAITGMDSSFLELGEKKIPIGEKYKTSIARLFRGDQR
jgi:two-component system LytT family response regulator